MANTKPLEDDNDFYNQGDPGLDAESTRFLTEYSGIPTDKIVAHVRRIRDEAWQRFPYPCIGLYKFIDFSIVNTIQYPSVLRRVRQGDKLLDLGCCFGHALRKLVYDGAPGENLVGLELILEFIELGYELFQDRVKLKADLRVGDVFNPDGPGFCNHTIDIVHAGAFFHVFNWEEQVEALCITVRLLKPKAGSMIFGRQTGVDKPGNMKQPFSRSGEMYRNNLQTFHTLVEIVAQKTETKLECQVDWLDSMDRSKDDEDGWRLLKFCITML